MKRIAEWLTDHGFIKLGIWVCERSGGHNPIWHNVYGLEPDMRCRHCSGKQ